MKFSLVILLLGITSAFALPQQEQIREQQERQESPMDRRNLIRKVPEDIGDRTYSSPVDRIDEAQQELEIDEERDRAEEKARED